MPTKVKCLASLEAGKRDLGLDDIEIKILYCGICHSDIHHVRNNWGPDGYAYPVVPGHEIVGKVFRVGTEVSKFKVGDSVGVGCMVDSCQTCATCKNDREQYCDSATFTYGSVDRRDGSRTYGGYTETIVVTEKFVLSIPESLDLAGAAPLLCAGITTYSPLRRWGAHPGSKVGVVGLGGLGHMALKLAKAMGADVTLFSRSHGKAEDAKRLGADQFLISLDPEQMETAAGQFDLIIDTVPYKHDPTVNSAPLVLRSQNLAGSLIGGIKETQEMLEFCGQHKIMSDIEVIDARDLHSAYERLVKGDVMQRFVIDITTL
ncbi:chaperonin 10-like protein [Lipomyces tetrasporus]|uniref:Chaperonin 10-like protein n=1 Tax=Lipomyces tetrasporus TaxID=54092 RepID=A0AAD7QPG6_9ASCO|nr:chaperonin 10-like protein [Lipomyces tetrasporus]KAJ8098541.1 chaperonin 10-like protein [Lipomyces tetrasporus]